MIAEGCDMDSEARVSVNQDGSVLIPGLIVKALGIKAGDDVLVRVEQGELRITTLKSRVQRAQRRVRRYIKPGRSLARELITERRATAEREKG
jgi:bifunctional DNA-binding transcriptional regulator/antitoxin component of YhaV-PrlF toxin-antitoxin module